MAYVGLKYHRSYTLEVREFGGSGWAAHIYAPRAEQRAKKMGIVTTLRANGLEEILNAARSAIDEELAALRPA